MRRASQQITKTYTRGQRPRNGGGSSATWRTSSLSSTLNRLASAYEVGEYTIRARDSGRQLPEPGVRRKDIRALADGREQRAALERFLAGVVRFEHRLVARIPF